MSRYNCLFLDRDGVINKHRPADYVKDWDEFEFLDGVFDALAKLNNQFPFIFIVTNQRAVSKRIMSEQTLLDIHARMLAEIEKKGGRIDKVYYCTALSEDDFYRKPNPGMGLQAKKDFPEIEFAKSVIVGDSDSDIEFGKRLGMKTIKVGKRGLIEALDQLNTDD